MIAIANGRITAAWIGTSGSDMLQLLKTTFVFVAANSNHELV